MTPSFAVKVVVMPKPEVADPQGQAIESALARLSVKEIQGVKASGIRVGKIFRLTLQAEDRPGAEKALHVLADKVLANPNVETFTCSIEENS